MADSPCNQPRLEQISTGQAGPEVNRDLEQLFRAVNRLIRCVGKVSNFLDGASGGAFDGGSSDGTTDPVLVGTPTPSGDAGSALILSTSSNTTLPAGSGFAAIEPTASIEVTLGAPWAGADMLIQHTGSANTITVKNDLGATIATLTTGQYMTARALVTSAGVPEWTAEVPGSDTWYIAVGGAYVNTTGVNPATELGYGTWAPAAPIGTYESPSFRLTLVPDL